MVFGVSSTGDVFLSDVDIGVVGLLDDASMVGLTNGVDSTAAPDVKECCGLLSFNLQKEQCERLLFFHW